MVGLAKKTGGVFFYKKVGAEKAREREAGKRMLEGIHFLYRCKKLGMELEEELKEARGG